MKKAVIFGDRKAGIVEVPDPKPKEDWVVVKVHASAMCTEYKKFAAGKKLDKTGHEGAGEVVELAQPVSGIRVGDRVAILPQHACFQCELCLSGDWIYCENEFDHDSFMGTPEGWGTFAEYMVKPSWLLKKIPDGVSYEYATMVTDGIGTPYGALKAIGLDSVDTVLITGLGPVGLGGVVNARFKGARVIGVEPQSWRRDRATQMGADLVLDPNDEDILGKIREHTGGRGVDCAMDCSGTIQGERLCLDAVRRRGRVVFVGQSSKELPIKVSRDLISKGLTLVGNWCWRMDDLPEIMHVIQKSDSIDLLISHVFPMSRIQDAFELLTRGECAKVVLKPWE